MSPSPYTAHIAKQSNVAKQASLRQSAPAPADGALTDDGSWGLNAMLSAARSGGQLVAPRPPTADPSPPSGITSGSKSPMAFRARRFNNSPSESEVSSPPADRGARKRSEGGPAPVTALTPTAPALLRQSSSGSQVSSPGLPRPTTSPAATILAAYTTGPGSPASANGLNSSLGGTSGLPAGSAAKVLRPRSSGSAASAAGTSTTASATASGSSKVLKTRLGEEGHAAGTPTLSLREKVAVLQRANKALEQQLAEVQHEAQQRAAAQHAEHATQVAALQQRLEEAEAQLGQQQRAAAELGAQNKDLAAAQQQLTAQLTEARRAAKAASAAAAAATAAAAAKQHAAAAAPPPAAAAVVAVTAQEVGGKDGAKSADGEGAGSRGGSGGGDGQSSPRTPLGWDGLAGGGSGGGSSSASSASGIQAGGGAPAAPATAPPAPAQPPHPHAEEPAPNHRVLPHGGGGSGSGSGRRFSEDTPHPHALRPLSPRGSNSSLPDEAALIAGAAAGVPGRPHTAPHSNYLARNRSGGGSSSAGDIPGEAGASLLLLSRSDPDISALASLSSHAAPSSDLRRAAIVHAAATASPSTAPPGADAVYLAGVGPPPASPVAAAAGLSGAGVALLARQKKLIASLRAQLQQKDSAYAFLAAEHSELEGQLKEVEAAKREYAARYAFMVLDQDLDGHIRTDQVGSFEMFGCYAPAVLEYAFKHWRFASGFKGYLNMDDFVRFVTLADDRTSRDSQRFWFGVLDQDGDGRVGAEDAKWFYDAVEKDESAFVVGFEDLWHQLLDMTQPSRPRLGFNSADLYKCKLGAGAIGLLLNHNNMLLHRTTAEWGRGDFPL